MISALSSPRTQVESVLVPFQLCTQAKMSRSAYVFFFCHVDMTRESLYLARTKYSTSDDFSAFLPPFTSRVGIAVSPHYVQVTRESRPLALLLIDFGGQLFP